MHDQFYKRGVDINDQRNTHTGINTCIRTGVTKECRKRGKG